VAADHPRNVAADEIDKARAAKRDFTLEQSLHAAVATRRPGSTPSSPTAAVAPEEAERHELLLRIAAAVEQLPDDQREPSSTRTCSAWPWQDRRRDGQDEKAVAGLLLRGRRSRTAARRPGRPP